MDHDGAVRPADGIKIVGILLIKNEDLFIERIVSNIIDFCDEIIVADHKSTDRTAEVVRPLAAKFAKIRYFAIDHPAESHELIAGYADSPTWIFGVDGDEVYDPNGLMILRRKILGGEYRRWWMILGNALHCIEVDGKRRTARGYLSPPCRSMTKLYNFAGIKSWSGPCPERLHGGSVHFHPQYSMDDRLPLYEEVAWDRSFFRCLHLCFLPRSSKDAAKPGNLTLRENISEKNATGLWGKIVNFLAGWRGGRDVSQYKREKYMRGPVVETGTEPFFPVETGGAGPQEH